MNNKLKLKVHDITVYESNIRKWLNGVAAWQNMENDAALRKCYCMPEVCQHCSAAGKIFCGK